ncbi:peptide-methionine (S)-S-oxide reductase MsrA [Flavicella sp.]|uniref:peptide-methionine (S)-S-oxide reductase MsrA n=1 Tax=Flavicella sp. TaxID=2957742 RepID=UPI0026076896|nr:peptide-methionine (S)-S-oxide reductase MsrA [Flavicella sp.]MDG1803894.1 peptide-methionine (S)-S-oxide reductase MsrA [Flavicella sp.]
MLNKKFVMALVAMFFVFNSLEAQNYEKKVKKGELKVAYFASGCFWCVEAIYESVRGVEEAVSGYSGGHTKNPTYKSTGTGKTGHAETVAVYYNPKIVSYESLVEVYFGSQDPTTFGQNPDFGSPYRSIIFYQNSNEKLIATTMFDALNKEVYRNKMITEIKAFEKFYEAEDYHQDFEKLNPNNGYVRNVSIPRLNRFKKAYPELLK